MVDMKVDEDIDGLMQERRNSIANALELHLSYIKPSIWWWGGLTMTSLDFSDGTWIVTAFSGPESDMDPTGEVHVVLCGEKCESAPLPLTCDQEKPEKEQEYTINVEEDIGDVFKIRVGFADISQDQSWFIEKVCSSFPQSFVQNQANSNTSLIP